MRRALLVLAGLGVAGLGVLALLPSPIDAVTYRARGLPWFDLYDEHLPAVAAVARLAGLKAAAFDAGAPGPPDDGRPG